MDSTNSSQPHQLVALYSAPEINRITGLGTNAARLRAEELAAMYAELHTSAPHRHSRGKQYFEGRTGVTRAC